MNCGVVGDDFTPEQRLSSRNLAPGSDPERFDCNGSLWQPTSMSAVFLRDAFNVLTVAKVTGETYLQQRVDDGFAGAERPRVHSARTICDHTRYLGCNQHKKHIGLLLTKGDGSILETWLHENSYHFSALVVLDGSKSELARKVLHGCPSVYYYHEMDFTHMRYYSDGELRELGHQLVSKHFGYNVWITMVHTDEFFVHSPVAAAQFAEMHNADYIKWRALHVLPHPSEYRAYLSNPNAPVTSLFRHYHHFGPRRKPGAFLESRTFFSTRGLRWSQKHAQILPFNLRRRASIRPAYLHFKLHNLSLDVYDEAGYHKGHWNNVHINSSNKNSVPRVRFEIGRAHV